MDRRRRGTHRIEDKIEGRARRFRPRLAGRGAARESGSFFSHLIGVLLIITTAVVIMTHEQ